MSVHIVGSHADIVDSINKFSGKYHSQFFKVRAIGQSYLASPVSTGHVTPLTKELRDVLVSWGAGGRKAPDVQSALHFEAILSDQGVHAVLQSLAATSLSLMGVAGGARSIAANFDTPSAPRDFDAGLFRVLAALAGGLFVNNTNATYPMKAVLLITGLMPAFDSQVKAGLGRGGFHGTDKTQYLLPRDASRADGKKISRLPFLLGDCWRSFSSLLTSAIASSNFRQLANHPGRVFDVLLFMQANEKRPVIVAYRPPPNDWYALQ
jgi:hypothetical protein